MHQPALRRSQNVSWSVCPPIRAGNLWSWCPHAQEGGHRDDQLHAGISDGGELAAATYVITVDNSGVGTKACIATVAATCREPQHHIRGAGPEGRGSSGSRRSRSPGIAERRLIQVASNTGGTANATTGTTSRRRPARRISCSPSRPFTTTAATCGAGYTGVDDRRIVSHEVLLKNTVAAWRAVNDLPPTGKREHLRLPQSPRLQAPPTPQVCYPGCGETLILHVTW